ncbi:MAG: hypothetical protein F6K35_23770 [Okeania sp. SIO2H7]|nr:hypothetical protein [Okeania sp. SIO2H7]
MEKASAQRLLASDLFGIWELLKEGNSLACKGQGGDKKASNFGFNLTGMHPIFLNQNLRKVINKFKN